MRGKVTASRLNVRSRPEMHGAKIGLLTHDTVVEILGHEGYWYEIKFEGGSAFVHSEFVDVIEHVKSMRGKVKASMLNVRDQPGIGGSIVGSLARDTVVDIVGEHSDWLEIEFNDSLVFVHGDYVDLIEAGYPTQGKVAADVLNVRRQPNLSGEIAGSLSRSAVINTVSKVGDWYEIRFNGAPAYVHDSCIDITGEQEADAAVATPTDVSVVSPDRVDETDPKSIPLVPAQKLEIVGSSEQRKVARTWNKFGGLLEALSGKHQIDPGSAVAVLCVESAGKGFEKNNDDKMIVRFENHKFWTYWGKNSTTDFHQHFKYSKEKVWLGHEWRKTSEDEWQTFHGSQPKEWQVLDFARSLDDTAALSSISMGAPQIMGFHHRRIGYNTVQDMFDRFDSDIRYHILGLFEFLDQRMIKALRNLDFVTFAASYNGSGQKEEYGQWIQNHFNAYKGLTLV